MAKRKLSGVPAELAICLGDPGMTPLLRAGLGGLAASLRAALMASNPRARWPSPVPLGKGSAVVEPDRVTLSWQAAQPERVLRALFEGAFRLDTAYGLIDLPGAYEPVHPPSVEIVFALQEGLKRTFLQHGKTTKKAAKAKTVQFEVDDKPVTVALQSYTWFAQQDAWEAVTKALQRGEVELAGWAYPGAAQRHIAYAGTKCEYTAGQAICACFALVGCLSCRVPSGGALVIPEPNDLVRFAEVRPLLTPKTLSDAYLTGLGDAVLAVHLALRMDRASRDRPGVEQAHGVMLRTTPWAKQQKSRVATLSPDSVPDKVLDLYDLAIRQLPTRIVPRERVNGEDDGEPGFFPATSALRGFVTENLASGRRWFAGFATATTLEKRPRFIHYYRDAKNLGALFLSEKKGLVAMLKSLDEAENALVASVHVALRQRFGAIASEMKSNPGGMKNRFQGERDKWRLAFAGSKTPEQIRAALADLWSRAGPNRELQARWQEVLPLLRADTWQTARDLALVALASYQGAGADAEAASERGERSTP